jgi:hypothetical protein
LHCRFTLASPKKGAPAMSKADVKICGMSASYVSLAVLACQNSAVALLMRFSRSDPAERMYLSSTAVMSSEFVKLVVAIALLMQVVSPPPPC